MTNANEPCVVIESDVTIVSTDGQEWHSDSSVTAATLNEVVLIHPQDAAVFLSALTPVKATAFRNNYKVKQENISLKISRITIGKNHVIAIGSANPHCSWDGCQLDLFMDLQGQGKIGPSSTFSEDLASPRSYRELKQKINFIYVYRGTFTTAPQPHPM